MKPDDLSELSRELAALTPANRRERLIHYLASDSGSTDEETSPDWFDQLVAGASRMSLAHAAAQRFAEAARPSCPPPRLPSARLRRLRFQGEEKEARVLAENLPETYLQDREMPDSHDLRPSLHRVDPAWIPCAKGAWERAKAALDYDGPGDFLIDRDDPGLSVRVIPWLGFSGRGGENPSRVVFSPASLALPEPELAFLAGAALAEMLFDHGHYQSLRSERPERTPLATLPAALEAAWLRWRTKAPVSTDRAGLLACGSFGAGMRALLRSVLGLPASALPTDELAILEGSGPPRREEFPSTLRMRLEAMHLFAEAFLASPGEGEAGGLKLLDHPGGAGEADRPVERSIDDAVEQLFPLRRPIADSPHADDLAKALAAAGILVLAADGRLESVETRLLVDSLFLHFTDEPEILLLDASADPAGHLENALEGLKPVAGGQEAEWLLDRLVEVALADGRLLGFEAPVISRVSEVLGLSAEQVSRAVGRVEGRHREDALPHHAGAVLRG